MPSKNLLVQSCMFGAAQYLLENHVRLRSGSILLQFHLRFTRAPAWSKIIRTGFCRLSTSTSTCFLIMLRRDRNIFSRRGTPEKYPHLNFSKILSRSSVRCRLRMCWLGSKPTSKASPCSRNTTLCESVCVGSSASLHPSTLPGGRLHPVVCFDEFTGHLCADLFCVDKEWFRQTMVWLQSHHHA